MTDTTDTPPAENPMGLDGFEFVEFAAPKPGVIEPVFEMLGFTKVATHRSKDVDLYRQGGINFILNREPKSPAAYFAEEHGPSPCGLAFRVKDSHVAYARALELGAQPMDMQTGPMELRLPAIKGIGGAALYLSDDERRDRLRSSIFNHDAVFAQESPLIMDETTTRTELRRRYRFEKQLGVGAFGEVWKARVKARRRVPWARH
mgnify:CR=1 FL=1